jgi:prepilin-type N-terminal cleavage/methylation domain-containing protein/prepilin-type processing-associated H-X9-DG protein
MPSPRHGFTMLELLVSLAVVSVLLAILLPALATARVTNHRSLCAGNQRLIGEAWEAHLEANDDRYPIVRVQPGWRYAGVRFSSVHGDPFLDYDRPLTRYLPMSRLQGQAESVFACPADRGITDAHGEAGTGRRSAYEAFGTSYRANSELLLPRAETSEALARGEITTAPSRLLVIGDPIWHEVLESTGLLASWHGAPDAGNMLFLDGSVRFVTMRPRPEVGPAVVDPTAPDLAFPRGSEAPDR